MTRPSTLNLGLAALLLAATASLAQPESAAGLLERFFEALNADEPAAMEAFAEEGFTEAFRQRRSAEEHRAFYERVRRDLGRLTVREMRREGPSRAVVMLAAEKTPLPVEFVFELASGRIDGFSVRVGGPPTERPAAVELPAGATDAEVATAFDKQLTERAAGDRFSGVVLLARDGEPFFHRAYGLANRETGRAVAPETRFDVGSITKLMTKIAIARLAQEGKLELDDTLDRHLPDYPNAEAAKQITLGQLVEHRSGLGDIFGPAWAEADRSAYVEPEDFFPLFADQPLRFAPGEGRFYSNAGYVTLGAVIAAVSGKPYFDYVEEMIFRPAGMSRSGFPRKDGTDPQIAIGYTRGGPTGAGDPGAPLEPNLGMLPIRGCPAGSSTHTATDLLALDRALRSGVLLDEKWTAWVLGASAGEDAATASLGIAGGGPGVSAGWESDGDLSVIVLANLDPPAGEGLAIDLYLTLSARARPGGDRPRPGE